tara:strand:+ start:907 stop:1494 length:588 start_codon:yes stop_codon:yes gene_type:complete
MKIISGKSFFASFIIIIIFSFIINIFLSDKSILNNKEKLKNVFLNNVPKKNKEKILGVKIHQQNKKGEKFLIVAESLIESESADKKIILENSLTTINQKGILTIISAGHAIISNNYDSFDFSNKVKITKEQRKFVLKTNSLTGTFEKGNYNTNEDVHIVSGNTKIKGKGLNIKKNGQYIKIKGKATLNMLLANKK